MLIIDKARELIKDKEFDCQGNSRLCYYVTIDGKEYALLVYKCNNVERNNLRPSSINYLKNQGLSTPGIVGVDYDGETAYELQEKCNGKPMAFRNANRAGGEDIYFNDFLETLKTLDNADPSTFINLMNGARIVHINGYSLDCHPDNFMLDNDGNITFMDLVIDREPTTKSESIGNYVNVLPWIFSFSVSKLNSENYDTFLPLLKSIGYKWFYQCINYLSTFDLTPDEINNIISDISFNYFMIDQTEKDNMINNYFSNDMSRKGK